MENDFDAKDFVATWEAIELDNPWIAEANDPPFSKYMLARSRHSQNWNAFLYRVTGASDSASILKTCALSIR